MENIELAMGAKINFENFATVNPHLPIKENALWIIAMDQLQELITSLEESELEIGKA